MRKGFTLIELLIVVAIIAILAAIAVPNFLEAQVRAKVSRCHADMRSLATAIESYAVDNNKYPHLKNPMTTEPRTWNDFLSVSGPGVTGFANALSTPVAYISSYPGMGFDIRREDQSGTIYTDANGYDPSYVFANFQGAASDTDLKDATGGLVTEWADKVQVPTPVLLKGQESATFANWILLSVGPVGLLDLQPGTTSPYGDAHGCVRNFFWSQNHYKGLTSGSYEIYDPTNGTVSYGLIWRLGGSGVAK